MREVARGDKHYLRNLQIAKHIKSVHWAEPSPYWFVLCDLQIFSGYVYHPGQPVVIVLCFQLRHLTTQGTRRNSISSCAFHWKVSENIYMVPHQDQMVSDKMVPVCLHVCQWRQASVFCTKEKYKPAYSQVCTETKRLFNFKLARRVHYRHFEHSGVTRCLCMHFFHPSRWYKACFFPCVCSSVCTALMRPT